MRLDFFKVAVGRRRGHPICAQRKHWSKKVEMAGRTQKHTVETDNCERLSKYKDPDDNEIKSFEIRGGRAVCLPNLLVPSSIQGKERVDTIAKIESTKNAGLIDERNAKKEKSEHG